MAGEIFGPILPVIAVGSIDEATAFVRGGDKPLALYVFSCSKACVETVLADTSSGGACVNGTMFHVTNPLLPFGGVGESGMGAYHGRTGFDTFSHQPKSARKPISGPPTMPRNCSIVAGAILPMANVANHCRATIRMAGQSR